MDLQEIGDHEADKYIEKYGDLAEAGRAFERAMLVGGQCSLSQRVTDLLINRAMAGDRLYRLIQIVDDQIEYTKIDEKAIGGRILQFNPSVVAFDTQVWDEIRTIMKGLAAHGKFNRSNEVQASEGSDSVSRVQGVGEEQGT